MSRSSRFFLQCLTYCMLIGLTCALIGKRVRNAPAVEFLFVVSISEIAPNDHTFGYYHMCTGTLIKPRFVVTAAHCLIHQTPSDVEIIAGSKDLSKGKRYYPESWITYDQWKIHQTDNHMMKNDIAVILMKGEGIRAIPPVNIWTVPDINLVNETVRVLGWGIMANGIKPLNLRMVLLQAISNEKCSSLGTHLKGKKFVVPSNYVCSKAEPWAVSTNGDGGAPVLTKGGYLVGINIGTCPRLEGNYSTEFLNENLLNSHLRIRDYKDFLEHFIN